MKYLTRDGATSYLREKTAPEVVSDGTLKDLASRGGGPTFSMVNGRALYRPEDLDRWLSEEAAKPVGRQRKAKDKRLAQSPHSGEASSPGAT